MSVTYTFRGFFHIKKFIPFLCAFYFPFYIFSFFENLIFLLYQDSSLQKKALIKVLQAAKSGNEAEFSRLLQELRKSRKRKTRKSKDSRLGITSTPLHSPDYMMADDDYYCQQQQQQPQQQPYQWVSCYKFSFIIQSYTL